MLFEKGVPIDDIDHPDSGTTALMTAVERNKWEITKMLLEMGANKERKARNGSTPLLMAAYRPQMMELFIKNGANIRAKRITRREYYI